MINIGVFCSSLDGKIIFSELARDLGKKIAQNNLSLVYGGGKLGLMGDIAKAAKSKGSTVISVIPDYLNKPSIRYNYNQIENRSSIYSFRLSRNL